MFLLAIFRRFFRPGEARGDLEFGQYQHTADTNLPLVSR